MSLESKALRIRTVVTDLRAHPFFFRGKIRIVPRNPWGNYSQGLLGRGKEHQGEDSGQHTQSLPFQQGLDSSGCRRGGKGAEVGDFLLALRLLELRDRTS